MSTNYFYAKFISYTVNADITGFQKLVRLNLQIKLSATTNMQALSLQDIVIVTKWYKTTLMSDFNFPILIEK